jgi:hypothetical protein
MYYLQKLHADDTWFRCSSLVTAARRRSERTAETIGRPEIIRQRPCDLPTLSIAKVNTPKRT